MRTYNRRFYPARPPLTFWQRHKFLIGIVAFVAFVFVACSPVVYNYAQVDTQTCTVTGKDRTSTGTQGQSDARVYTEQCGTLVVADSIIHPRFNSADLYGSLEVGKTYEMEVYGWRFGLFSMFPNILEAEEVN